MSKKYTKVIAEFSEDGIITPLSLFLDGEKYDVSMVVGTKRIAADIGGTGYCYELIVDNKI